MLCVCQVSGCTDDGACNFMEDATDEDGSCTFAGEGEVHQCDGSCWNDADGDGVCDEEEGMCLACVLMYLVV